VKTTYSCYTADTISIYPSINHLIKNVDRTGGLSNLDMKRF